MFNGRIFQSLSQQIYIFYGKTFLSFTGLVTKADFMPLFRCLTNNENGPLHDIVFENLGIFDKQSNNSINLS